MKNLFLTTIFFTLSMVNANGQSLENVFRAPAKEAKPIMIWQWMDGMANKEAITADLEAYRKAGIGGVQQFLVGGEMQTLVRDTTNAVGTEAWKDLMRHAINECKRLGLSFGTHNCPGWSSSAYPTVTPEYSMQKLVWSVTKVDGSKRRNVILPRPEVDPKYNYYEDIAIVAIPDSDSVNEDMVKVLTNSDALTVGNGDSEKTLIPKLGKGIWRIYRFGHTTNGKTNYATAPAGGLGLECDKMSREALDYYWAGYPSMLLDLVKDEDGKTFQRFEIDSYEAGEQVWTRNMRDEFIHRRGYDIFSWLPVAAGVTIGGTEATAKFVKDWKSTITDLCAENYYGYMSELVHQHPGMKLIVQPYGTGSFKPFYPIDGNKIVSKINAADFVCAEFWTRPNWGWPQVPDVVKEAHQTGHEIIFAEGFTCWPMHAWKDDPDDLKATADRAFCLGINSLMLHAGALNPWVGRLPGMTFGIWGTQWTPGQTWWQSGGAKKLFDYFTHCQALLQRGKFVDDYRSAQASLHTEAKTLQWTHRLDGDVDIYFIANTSDSLVKTTVNIDTDGRVPEIWNPQTQSIDEAKAWTRTGGKTSVALTMNARDAFFLVFRNQTESSGSGLETSEPVVANIINVTGAWTLNFPEGWGVPKSIELSTLTPWNESEIQGVKYFSGTARYNTTVKLKKIDRNNHYVLNLGTVKNLAVVNINGQSCDTLWRPPYCIDITEALHKGDNNIEVSVTNLWPNRLIGDEQEVDDIEWAEPYKFDSAPGKKEAGRMMKAIPEWLNKGLPRPSKNRKTVVSFKFFEKDASLLPSGLIGPVTIDQIEGNALKH